MPSFSNLRSEAEERWKPEEGGMYSVCAVEVRVGETKNGYPAINLWLEVIGNTPDAGERFWDGTYFSANKRGNNMSFAKLEAASKELTESFWASDPDEVAVEQKLMGSTFQVQTTFEENRDGGDPWLRCTYLPSEDKSQPDF
tara:strand:+ start:4213 stop:4638 length:426 start_codon:yes stop_codon:yes gene_type:complete